MRRFVETFVVMSALAVLVGQSGCGEPSDEELSPEQLQSRWASQHEGRPVGHAATFELTGSPLILTTDGTAQVDAPCTLVPGPIFPDDKYYVFFAEAQVGAQTGLLVLEGKRISVTAGTLGAVGISKATARTHREDGSAAPAVELKTRPAFSTTRPHVTFPEDWSLADRALFHSDASLIHPSDLTLSGFTRGVLVTESGSTALSGSVTVTSANHMRWDHASVIETTQASMIETPRFALGGEPQAGALSSSELASPPPLPGGVVGVQGRVLLQPGSARSEGSFQLTQAMTESGLLIPAEVQVAFDKKPIKVPHNDRSLLTVVYREKSLRGDAVLADLQVTGSGKEAVRVAIDEPETLVGELWDAVEDAGIVGPILAVPIAIATPFLALGEWLSCLFSTCPEAYPLWMKAGTVSRFHVIIQGDKLSPGTYAAEVTLTGRNYAPISIPVHFTIE